jgi:DNA modification methylase
MKIGSIEDLNPAPYNPRRIDQESLSGLQVSIRELGDVSCICFNERTKQMFAGHQRVKALKAEFGSDLKIVGDEATGFSILTPKGDRFPIRVVDWPEDKERLANLTANNHFIQGVWTETAEDVLGQADNDFPELCEQLRLNDLDLELLIAKGKKDHVGKGKDAEPDLDAGEELRKKWGVELGQIWEMGDHRILCGDCLDKALVDNFMAGEMAHMSFTDPPYGVDYGGHNHPLWSHKHAPIQNDALPADQMAAFWEAAFNMVADYVSNDLYVTAPGGPLNNTMAAAISKTPFEHHQWLIWVKDRLVLGRSNYHYRHEHIWYGWKKGKTSSWQGSTTEDSVWEIKRPSRSDDHPTMKPVELVQKALANSSMKGDTVFEPFSGSGTTIVACENMERKCLAIEVVPAYVAVALQRWSDAFQKTPKKLS